MNYTNRRSFLKTTGAGLLGAGVLSCWQCTQKEPMNILWLISEDTSPDLSCYGNPHVSTPNLDQLASEGMRFENVYATCPVCSPVRSAFMTGMHQTFIDAHQHRDNDPDPLPDLVQVITTYFREAGFFVSNGSGDDPTRPGKTDWNFTIDYDAFDGTDWRQRKEGQHFFSQFNFRLTHRPFERDEFRPIAADDVTAPPYYPDHPITRRDWANYLESLQVLDKQIGDMLARLEKDGLAENTIVVYFGDHGRPMVRDKQWLYEGGIRVPMIIRWPGKIKGGTVNKDLVSLIDLAPTCLDAIGETPPEHLQGIDIFNRRQKRDYVFAARDRCDGTIDRIRCVRDKQYKLIRNFYPERPYTQFNGYKKYRYPVLTLMQILHREGKLTPEQAHFMADTRPEYELYDLRNDPHELSNLADDADYADVRVRLENALNEWLATYDTATYPESAEQREYAIEKMQENFKIRMTEQGVSPDISDEDYLQWWEKQLFSEPAE